MPTKWDPHPEYNTHDGMVEVTSEGEFNAILDELKAHKQGVLNCPVVEKYLALLGRRSYQETLVDVA